MKKRIAIIGTVGVPANYGGFETLTEHLIENLSEKYAITVYCSGRKYCKDERKKEYKKARLKYLPFDANGIQSIIYDSISILHSLLFADVLLILGVAGAWLIPFVKIFTNKKIIVSIDGIEWKREKWNLLAKWYLFWAESVAVKYSHIDISDNESIQDYTAMRYGSLSRIIEYGADHTMRVLPTAADKLEYPFLKFPYAFKVCRIEPENNVHEVLKAFSEMPSYKLVMVGNWEKSEYGRSLKEQYSTYENIQILDPIYDQRKLDLLRGNAHVYIHGHSAGGTNPSLVEAMHLGLPIFAFGVSYNRTTTEHRAAYFTDASDLKELVRRTSFEEFQKMGATMSHIAQRRYTWGLISQKYDALVEEALAVKSKSSVRSGFTEMEESELASMSLAHLKNQDLFYTNR